jgi:membrane-associated protease RseP (regulator of RpoE activity)
MAALQTLLAYKWVILFYGGIILLLYIYRKRFESQGALVKLYRTKLGLNAMDRIASNRHKREHMGETIIRNALPLIGILTLLLLPGLFGWVTYPKVLHSIIIISISILLAIYILAIIIFRPIRLASLHGVYIGYAGMLLIVCFIIYGVYQVIFVPGAPPPLQPVIPGVPIPGSPIKVPLIIGWIALFISAVIHEFSHGVVSRAYGIKVKSSGFAFIGPLAAAFVEPDEKKVARSKKKVQNSIFAAGPFSNILLASLMILILSFILTPIISAYLRPAGVTFQSVQQGYPAEAAGIMPETVYTMVNGEPIIDVPSFFTAVENLTPNETITLGNAKTTTTIIATTNPQNATKGYLGVMGPDTFYENEKTPFAVIIIWIAKLLNWIFIISLGLGLANLLPLGPVDGGRLFNTAAITAFGKKKGKKVWTYVTIAFIIIIIVLFYPIIKATFLALIKALHII